MESRMPIAIITFTLVIFLYACTNAGAQSVTFVVENNCPYRVWPGTLTAAGRQHISSTGFTLATGASSSLRICVELSSLSTACTHAGAQSVTFDFTNNCPYTVWPGTLTAAGSPSLSSTGFTLAAGASHSLSVPVNWSGRLWARTQCSTNASGKFVCATADCDSGVIECNGAGAIPPASLAEFTLNGRGGLDFYDISLVDGFNIPISVTPQGGSTGCPSTSCAANVNAVCDPSLAVRGPDGTVIACKSACLAFNQPQYCCTGDYCPPSQYSRTFKQQCPQAYSYAYDDTSSTFICPSVGNYLITFCP